MLILGQKYTFTERNLLDHDENKEFIQSYL